jgi:hypothetical protein
MIPIAPTVFWGPMAFAIMGGLLVATILTLIFLPTLYVVWFKGTEGSSGPSVGTGIDAKRASHQAASRLDSDLQKT